VTAKQYLIKGSLEMRICRSVIRLYNTTLQMINCLFQGISSSP